MSHDPEGPEERFFPFRGADPRYDRPASTPKMSAADRAAQVGAWVVGLLFALIIVGGLLWVVVRIWKDIPW